MLGAKIIFLNLVLLSFGTLGCQKTDQENTKELTMFGVFTGMVFDESWEVFQKAEELTGIKLKRVSSKNQTIETEAYNLLLASGKLPDLIRYADIKTLEKLGQDGGLVPLNDLIKDYAPHINKFFDDNPNFRKEATAIDKNIYIIPFYRDYYANKVSTLYFIRNDWLKKLNLKPPNTINEFYNILKAFRTQDPNKNGKQDEIPFFTRHVPVEEKLAVMLDIFQLKYRWRINENNVSYDPVKIEYKEAIKELAKWYKEGLIDQEIFSRGANSRDYVFNNNLGGVTIDWATTANYININKDNIPGFDLDVMLPPIVKGLRKTLLSRTKVNGAWGISSQSKNPIAAIQYMDFWFSPEGRRLWNYGIEGKSYQLVDNTPIFTDFVLKNSEGKNPLQVLYSMGAQWQIGTQQDNNYELQMTQPVVIKGYSDYEKNNIVIDLVDPRSLRYEPNDLDAFNKIDAQLLDYSNEMTQKWIMGASDIDKDWESYLSRLKMIGLEKAIALQKSAAHLYFLE